MVWVRVPCRSGGRLSVVSVECGDRGFAPVGEAGGYRRGRHWAVDSQQRRAHLRATAELQGAVQSEKWLKLRTAGRGMLCRSQAGTQYSSSPLAVPVPPGRIQ
jgi:hypothetical protein